MAQEGSACRLDAIFLCITMHAQEVWIQSGRLSGLSGSPAPDKKELTEGLLQSVPSLQVSVAMLYYSIVMVSLGSLSTGSPSVSSLSSGECGNAILQYCYVFNRCHLWLLAQGLLQSVLSLKVSVAMPYYSIILVSIGISSGS